VLKWGMVWWDGDNLFLGGWCVQIGGGECSLRLLRGIRGHKGVGRGWVEMELLEESF
jgi:hypothetical protein